MPNKQTIRKKHVRIPGTSISAHRMENTEVKVPKDIKKRFDAQAKQWFLTQEKHEQKLKARGKSREHVEAREAVLTKIAKKLDLHDELVLLSKLESQRTKEAKKATRRAQKRSTRSC